jgi:hypothetical protein
MPSYFSDMRSNRIRASRRPLVFAIQNPLCSLFGGRAGLVGTMDGDDDDLLEGCYHGIQVRRVLLPDS